MGELDGFCAVVPVEPGRAVVACNAGGVCDRSGAEEGRIIDDANDFLQDGAGGWALDFLSGGGAEGCADDSAAAWAAVVVADVSAAAHAAGGQLPSGGAG